MQVDTLEARQQAPALGNTELSDAHTIIQNARSENNTLSTSVKETEYKAQLYYGALLEAQQMGARFIQEVAHLKQKKEIAFEQINQLITQRDEFKNAKYMLMREMQLTEETKANMDTELEKREARAATRK
jgi:hypothetical protein